MNGWTQAESSDALQAAFAATRQRIRNAAIAARRSPQSVRLLAVSKTFAAEDVLGLAALGQRAFGENYLQEALAKMDACARADPRLAGALEWHFIGPIQSNKTRPIAERFDWVHSIDRVRIATRLGEQRPAQRPPLACCVQVNVSAEASKSGCTPSEAIEIARAILAQPRLSLRGVMVIPEPWEDPERHRLRFGQAREILEALQRALPEAAETLSTLSMGMSADLEPAIAEGATIVRIGSALFGARKRPEKFVG